MYINGGNVKALSLWPEWAMPVSLGIKTVECRTWGTEYRGPLVICSSNKPLDGTIHGHALCVVDLVSVVPFREEHCDYALIDEFKDGSFAWVLENVRLIKPFPVKGRQRIFDVPDESIEIVGPPCRSTVEEYFLPLVYRAANSEADDIWSEVFEYLPD